MNPPVHETVEEMWFSKLGQNPNEVTFGIETLQGEDVVHPRHAEGQVNAFLQTNEATPVAGQVTNAVWFHVSFFQFKFEYGDKKSLALSRQGNVSKLPINCFYERAVSNS
jgi:hypothetical protein